jgi:hypothetical protein
MTTETPQGADQMTIETQAKNERASRTLEDVELDSVAGGGFIMKDGAIWNPHW